MRSSDSPNPPLLATWYFNKLVLGNKCIVLLRASYHATVLRNNKNVLAIRVARLYLFDLIEVWCRHFSLFSRGPTHAAVHLIETEVVKGSYCSYWGLWLESYWVHDGWVRRTKAMLFLCEGIESRESEDRCLLFFVVIPPKIVFGRKLMFFKMCMFFKK